MGLVTCAVSGLPICEGDAVRFMLLVESPLRSRFGGALSIVERWFVRTPPLACVYDGNLWVRNPPEDIQTAVWLRGLQEDLIEGPGDPGRSIPPITRSIGFRDLGYAVSEGHVSVESEGGRARNDARIKLRTDRMKRLFPSMLESAAKVTDSDVDPRIGSVMPLRVSSVFIREDVWQLLLKMTGVGPSMNRLTEDTKHFTDDEDRPHFQIGPCAHLQMARDILGDNEELPMSLRRSVVEFLHVQSVLTQTGFVWRPSTQALRETNWGLHASLHEQISRIAREASVTNES